MAKYISKSASDTFCIAKNFGQTLKGGDVVLLDGEMGAGKTVFAKGIAAACGVKETVTSPTFTIHNIYEGKEITLNHFDFYRINDKYEAEELGLEEYFYMQNGVSVIEWSGVIKHLLPKRLIYVTIVKMGDETRELEIREEDATRE